MVTLLSKKWFEYEKSCPILLTEQPVKTVWTYRYE